MTRQPKEKTRKYKVLFRKAPIIKDLTPKQRAKFRAKHEELMADPNWITITELAALRGCTRQAVVHWLTGHPECPHKVAPGANGAIFINVAEAARLYKPHRRLKRVS